MGEDPKCVRLRRGSNPGKQSEEHPCQYGGLHLVGIWPEISDFKPCAHAQCNVLHIKYAEKTDD